MPNALDDKHLFLRRLDCATYATMIGRHDEAEVAWKLADAMGREWPQNFYRPGQAEFIYVQLQYDRGLLTQDLIDKTAALASGAKNRATLRDIEELRCKWLMSKGEWAKSRPHLEEALRMAREVGDLTVGNKLEVHISLAKLRSGDKTYDARADAESLSKLSDPPNLVLAQLWQAIGDVKRAAPFALAAYKDAWGDGEPYCYRHALDQAIALLNDLQVPIPVLPAYDPARDPPEPWELELKAVIAEERNRKAAGSAK